MLFPNTTKGALPPGRRPLERSLRLPAATTALFPSISRRRLGEVCAHFPARHNSLPARPHRDEKRESKLEKNPIRPPKCPHNLPPTARRQQSNLLSLSLFTIAKGEGLAMSNYVGSGQRAEFSIVVPDGLLPQMIPVLIILWMGTSLETNDVPLECI